MIVVLLAVNECIEKVARFVGSFQSVFFLENTFKWMNSCRSNRLVFADSLFHCHITLVCARLVVHGHVGTDCVIQMYITCASLQFSLTVQSAGQPVRRFPDFE